MTALIERTVARVPGIAWVALLVVALLGAGAFGIARAAGERGRQAQALAQADSVRAAAGAHVLIARAATRVSDARAAQDSVTRDSASLLSVRLDARRDSVRRLLAASRSAFTIHGDTAVIAGHADPVVLPHEITEALELHDVALTAIDAASAAHARADSATLQLLADRGQQIIARDQTIAALDAQVAADSTVIKTLREIKQPRVGFRAGVAVGVATTVATVSVIAKLVSLLR